MPGPPLVAARVSAMPARVCRYCQLRRWASRRASGPLTERPPAAPACRTETSPCSTTCCAKTLWRWRPSSTVSAVPAAPAVGLTPRSTPRGTRRLPPCRPAWRVAAGTPPPPCGPAAFGRARSTTIVQVCTLESRPFKAPRSYVSFVHLVTTCCMQLCASLCASRIAHPACLTPSPVSAPCSPNRGLGLHELPQAVPPPPWHVLFRQRPRRDGGRAASSPVCPFAARLRQP